jgi:HD-like signal output (HDOD) protein
MNLQPELSQMKEDNKFTKRITGGKNWKDIVELVGDLPPMPNIAAKAVQLVEDPTVTAKKLNDVLANDAALTARILKIANSAMFARQREISTLTQAIMTIGFKSLKGIIVAAAMKQINQSSGNFQKVIWQKSVVTALGSTWIASALKKKYREEIYILGLLHNLGQLILLTNKKIQVEYEKIFEIITKEELDFVTVEQSNLGYAHPLIGALVAKKWNFSEETCDVILHYKDDLQGRTPEDQMREKAAVVQLAECITHESGVLNLKGYPSQRDNAIKLCHYLGIFSEKDEPTKLDELISEINERYQSDRALYE